MSDESTVMERSEEQTTETTETTQATEQSPTTETTEQSTQTTETQQQETDWRAEWASGDEKMAADLERFTVPVDVYKALKDTQRSLHDSGKVRIPNGESSDEDREAFRKLMDIPEAFKDYDLKPELPDGHAFNELDSEILTDVRQRWHEKGGVLALPEVQTALMEEYARMTDEVMARGVAASQEQHAATQQWMKDNWGGETDRNVGFATAFIDRYDQDGELTGKNGGENLLRKRFEDGTALGDYVPILKMLTAAGRDTVDDPLFLEASKAGGNGVDTLKAQKEAILDLRRQGKMQEYADKQAELERIEEALARQARQ